MRARHRAILRSSMVAKYISTVPPSVRTQVSSRVGINKIVRTGHHYSRDKKGGGRLLPPSKKKGEEVFPHCRTLLQNVVPRVVAPAQSLPWFLVIVDCGRITGNSE